MRTGIAMGLEAAAGRQPAWTGVFRAFRGGRDVPLDAQAKTEHHGLGQLAPAGGQKPAEGRTRDFHESGGGFVIQAFQVGQAHGFQLFDGQGQGGRLGAVVLVGAEESVGGNSAHLAAAFGS